MKDDFLATLSHELRTPLNAILGWSQILAVAAGTTTTCRGAADHRAQRPAQTQIIEELLDMSRIISGKVRLDVQRLDLAAVVQAAVDTLRPPPRPKRIRLRPCSIRWAAAVSVIPAAYSRCSEPAEQRG